MNNNIEQATGRPVFQTDTERKSSQVMIFCNFSSVTYPHIRLSLSSPAMSSPSISSPPLSSPAISAFPSKIRHGRLDQYGAEPFKQQQFGTAVVEGVKMSVH